MAEVRDESGAAAEEAAQTGGVGRWIVGVFTDPSATFEALAAKTQLPHKTDPNKTRDGSKWWVPFLIVLALSLVVAVVALNYILADQVDVIREALSAQGVPEEQIQQQIDITMRVGPIAGAGLAALLGVGLFFAAAGLGHGFSKVMGGKGRFRVSRAVVAYSSMVSALGILIKLPIMIAQKKPFVEFGPSLFFPNLGPSDWQFRLLMQFDIFMIAWVVVMVFGFSAGYRITKGKALLPAVLAWLIYAVVGLGSGGPRGG